MLFGESEQGKRWITPLGQGGFPQKQNWKWKEIALSYNPEKGPVSRRSDHVDKEEILRIGIDHVFEHDHVLEDGVSLLGNKLFLFYFSKLISFWTK